jgi:hypothetical protein
MTPAAAPVTCLDATGSVGIKKGPSDNARPFLPNNSNPEPLARCLDLARRPEDPMDATTEKEVR